MPADALLASAAPATSGSSDTVIAAGAVPTTTTSTPSTIGPPPSRRDRSFPNLRIVSLTALRTEPTDGADSTESGSDHESGTPSYIGSGIRTPDGYFDIPRDRYDSDGYGPIPHFHTRTEQFSHQNWLQRDRALASVPYQARHSNHHHSYNHRSGDVTPTRPHPGTALTPFRTHTKRSSLLSANARSRSTPALTSLRAQTHHQHRRPLAAAPNGEPSEPTPSGIPPPGPAIRAVSSMTGMMMLNHYRDHQPFSSGPVVQTAAGVVDNDDSGGWMYHAGMTITSETREARGHSWETHVADSLTIDVPAPSLPLPLPPSSPFSRQHHSYHHHNHYHQPSLRRHPLLSQRRVRSGTSSPVVAFAPSPGGLGSIQSRPMLHSRQGSYTSGGGAGSGAVGVVGGGNSRRGSRRESRGSVVIPTVAGLDTESHISAAAFADVVPQFLDLSERDLHDLRTIQQLRNRHKHRSGSGGYDVGAGAGHALLSPAVAGGYGDGVFSLSDDVGADDVSNQHDREIESLARQQRHSFLGALMDRVVGLTLYPPLDPDGVAEVVAGTAATNGTGTPTPTTTTNTPSHQDGTAELDFFTGDGIEQVNYRRRQRRPQTGAGVGSSTPPSSNVDEKKKQEEEDVDPGSGPVPTDRLDVRTVGVGLIPSSDRDVVAKCPPALPRSVAFAPDVVTIRDGLACSSSDRRDGVKVGGSADDQTALQGRADGGADPPTGWRDALWLLSVAGKVLF